MWPALIAAAASIIGGGMASAASSRSNRTNVLLANQNNEFQEKMIDKQAQYNIDQWNREAQFAKEQIADERAYNTAANQAARLREAGLNPALVMSGANAGTSSAASTPSGNSIGAPSGTPVTVQPNLAMASAIQNSMDNFSNYMQLNMARKKNDAEVALLHARALQEAEETRNKRFQNELNEATKEWTIASKNEEYLSRLQGRLIQEEQYKLVQQQKIYQELVNKNLPDKLAMEVAVMASQRDLNQFNTNTGVGKLIDELKSRGFKFDTTIEKIIFGVLSSAYLLNKVH